MIQNDPKRLPILAQIPDTSIPRALSGESGSNREFKETCQIPAKNDYEAILCWLEEYKHTKTTYRNYQKEAERLLLWCIFKKNKPLSSLDRTDFDEYFDFLSDPKPQAFWCSGKQGKNGKRGTPQWKPFIGPLSESAKRTTISVIGSLMRYLHEARYLSFDPIGLMRKKFRLTIDSEEETIQLQERILTLDEWHAMLKTLNEWEIKSEHQKTDQIRLRFLVAILFFLGLRINELATHTWKAFRQNSEGWWFYVKGKGGKVGKIPVNTYLLAELENYRKFFNLSLYPTSEENEPIIVSWRTGKALSTRHMGKLLKNLALETAKQFSDSPEKSKKLAKFSPHWLRHLSASMQDRAGISFKHIQANHRHVSDATTRRYIHALDKERYEDMEKLSWNIPS